MQIGDKVRHKISGSIGEIIDKNGEYYIARCEISNMADVEKNWELLESDNWVEERTWDEFRDTGMLWYTNMIISTFGWSIVTEVDDNNHVINAYPARTKYRGFDQDINEEGYQKVTDYLKTNIEQLSKETYM